MKSCPVLVAANPVSLCRCSLPVTLAPSTPLAFHAVRHGLPGHACGQQQAANLKMIDLHGEPQSTSPSPRRKRRCGQRQHPAHGPPMAPTKPVYQHRRTRAGLTLTPRARPSPPMPSGPAVDQPDGKSLKCLADKIGCRAMPTRWSVAKSGKMYFSDASMCAQDWAAATPACSTSSKAPPAASWNTGLLPRPARSRRQTLPMAWRC